MKKNILLHINIVISLIILSGVFCMTAINYTQYSRIIKRDIKNIAILTSSNILSEINSEMTKPIVVSLTMANDSFLKNWILNEPASLSLDDPMNQQLRDYLLGYQLKYGYSSVFFVSAKTNRYYHYRGLHKLLSEDDPHDIWYYTFLKKEKIHDLDVDTDQADNNLLTVFVNCRVEDAEKNLLGVVGVGVKMYQIQDILSYYTVHYGLESCLILESGLVQAHSDESQIEQTNIFDRFPQKEFRYNVQSNKTTWETFWYKNGDQNTFLVARYIPDLEWYMVVEHDSQVLQQALMSQVTQNLVITGIILILLLSLSSYLIHCFRKKMINIATIDELTGLPNRRACSERLISDLERYMSIGKERRAPFQSLYNGPERRARQGWPYVFMLDIDRFKVINDTKGHIIGDMVLIAVGKVTSSVLEDTGYVFRWDGDEFMAIVYCDEESCKKLAERLLQEIRELPEFKNNLTLSIGVTLLKEEDTLDILLRRTDKALCLAKKQGRSSIVYL